MNGTGAPTRSYRGSPERSGDGLRTESGKKRSNVESIHYLLCFLHIGYSRKPAIWDPCAIKILTKSHQIMVSDKRFKHVTPKYRNKPTHTHTASKAYPKSNTTYIKKQNDHQPNNKRISTDFWQSMDTRSYSKTQKQKMVGVPPCMLYLLGCPKSGRVQEKQMWLQN